MCEFPVESLNVWTISLLKIILLKNALRRGDLCFPRLRHVIETGKEFADAGAKGG